MSTRPFNQNNVPMVGSMDMTSVPFYIVCQMTDGIWLLIKTNYIGDDASANQPWSEYLFTPCYAGGVRGVTAGDLRPLIMTGLNRDSDGNYNTPILPHGVYGEVIQISGVGTQINFYFTADIPVEIPSFTFDGDNLTDVTSGNYVATRYSADGTFVISYETNSQDEASNYTLASLSSSTFDFPNTYAGVNYLFTWQGQIPFRFVQGYSEPANNYLLTPSSCQPTGIAPTKTNTFYCNDYTSISPFNLGRFVDISYDGSNTLATITRRQSGYLNYFNFFPVTGYYLGNANFVSSTLTPGDGLCNASMGDFLEQVFYFWYSGFSQFKNFGGSSYQQIVSQGTPGFIKTVSPPVSILGWTNQSDCQRTYFYTYCNIPNYCGDCYGSCISGTSCKVNTNYTAPTPQVNQEPFTCGEIIPPISTAKAFWDQYKWWIIGVSVFLLIAIIFCFILFSVISKSRNRENRQSEIVYSANSAAPATKTRFGSNDMTYYPPPNYGGEEMKTFSSSRYPSLESDYSSIS